MDSGPGDGNSKIRAWLVTALAFAIVANVVWSLIAPLVVPLAVVIVAGVVFMNVLRWWKHRHFW